MADWKRLRRWKGAWPAVLALVLVLAVLASDPAHRLLVELVQWTEELIRAHPVAGALAFVVASAASAMLAFFSSAVLIPAAAYAWGPWLTTLLLWLGWFVGGAFAYAIGRGLGRPLLAGAATTGRLGELRSRLPERITFSTALLVQLALPSEIPGYLFGILRVRPRIYLSAAALGELPYALAAVGFSQGLLDRRWTWLLAAGAAAALLIVVALALLRRRTRTTRGR